MTEIVLEITHPKKHVNYTAIENRLKHLEFVNKVHCNAEKHAVVVRGVSKTIQRVIVKNALFQMGYTAQIIND
jgi:hypothetical protein